MLKLTNITHRFDGKTVLAQVNVTLAPGQRIALMGPSGIGKTTLLRIALGLLQPTEGRVENSFSKPVAVFQEPRLLPWRSAVENVNLVLKDNLETLPKAKQALETLGLGAAVDQYPRELSGGMQQRVAIARALAAQGDLLVLDEPFKALDSALKKTVLDLVNQTSAAILLVTHEEGEAEMLGCEIMRI